MGRAEKARAVVLSSRPLGEADRIVRLFTRELGRVDAVVKGVRKTTSRWGGRLEPFNVCDLPGCSTRSQTLNLVLHPGRSLYTVTQAQLVDVFLRLRADREGLTAAAIVCEAAAGLTPEHEPEERVFALLRNTLRELDRGISGRAVQAPLVLGALLKLLYEAGYLPVLDHCAACGADGRALGFSAARGGLVCSDCVGEAVPITPEAIEALAASLSRPLAELREQPSSDATGEALRDVHQLYAYHTGSRLRALRIAGGG
jgi:DNA repair protein RecO (recombination protein O)